MSSKIDLIKLIWGIIVSHFSKESPEYKANGHYVIDGIEFMSIWSFKNRHGIKSDTVANGREGKELAAKGVEIHTSTADIDYSKPILIYKLSSLEEYYGV